MVVAVVLFVLFAALFLFIFFVFLVLFDLGRLFLGFDDHFGGRWSHIGLIFVL